MIVNTRARRAALPLAATSALLLTVTTLAPRPAAAQTEYTLRASGGGPLSEALNRPLNFSPLANAFLNDTGFDVEPFVDPDPTYPGRTIERVTVQQVSISSGLFALYQYDGTTPVFGNDNGGTTFLKAFTLSETQVNPFQISGDPPFFFHNHFDFQANQAGSYQFQFRLTGLRLIGDAPGTLRPDSDVYTINYVTSTTVIPHDDEASDIVIGAQNVIPEPSTLALLAGAIAAGPLAARRRRRA